MGTRVASLREVDEIVDAAVDELHRGFEYFLCAVLRIRSDGYVESVAARGLGLRPHRGRTLVPAAGVGPDRPLRARAPAGDRAATCAAEPDYRLVPFMVDVRSELCVPIWVGDGVWGAIDIEEVHPDAFDEDDARLVQTVADQVGSALRAADLAKQLEQAQEAVSASSEERQSASKLAS